MVFENVYKFKYKNKTQCTVKIDMKLSSLIMLVIAILTDFNFWTNDDDDKRVVVVAGTLLYCCI